MQWFKQLTKRLRGRNRHHERIAARRFRRLIMEQFEDRRVLASAADDSYSMEPNTTLAVGGYGTWANDSYNSSWTEPSCIEGEWQEGEWVCLIEGSTTSYASSSIGSGPSNGTLTLIDTGEYYYDGYGNIAGQYGLAFTYTPNANFAGIDTFSYQISDNYDSSTAWVSIQVTAPPTPPVANDDEYSTDEDAAIVVSILANDTDLNSDELTASIVSGPSYGSLTFGEGGSITYTPAANYHGSDSFTYVATDGALNSNTATVSLTVTSVPDAPIAVDDSYSVNPGDTLVILGAGVLANDSHPNSNLLTANVLSGPAHGDLTLNLDGSFTYLPDDDFVGVDSFSYSTNDLSLSDSATVTLAVTPGFRIGMSMTGSIQSTAFPPDTMGSVGPNHIVELVNDQFAVYDKATGEQLVRTTDEDFWATALGRGRKNAQWRLVLTPSFTTPFVIAYGSFSRVVEHVADSFAQRDILQAALSEIFGKGNIDVFRTSSNSYSLHFLGQLAATKLGQLTATGSSVDSFLQEDNGLGNEVQRLLFQGQVSGGAFSLGLGPNVQQVIWHPDPVTLQSNIQMALDLLAGEGNVKVLAPSLNEYRIHFCGELANQNLAPMTIASELTGGSARLELVLNGFTTPIDEIQRLAFSDVEGGTFMLAAAGFSTAGAIEWSNTPSTLRENIQGALDAIYGEGNAIVSLTATDVLTSTDVIDILFSKQLSKTNLPRLSLDDSQLTGASSEGRLTTIVDGVGNDIQRLSFTGAIDESSTFTLSYGPFSTAPITYSATESLLKTRISDALSAPQVLGPFGQDAAVVRVTGNNQFDVFFGGVLGSFDMAPLTITGDGFVSASTVAEGFGNETQRLTFTGLITEGSNSKISLRYGSRMVSGDILYSVDPATLQARIQSVLESSNMFGADNVTVIARSSSEYDVVFRGQVGSADLKALTVASTLTGGGTAALATIADGVGNEVHRYDLTGTALSGQAYITAYEATIGFQLSPDQNTLRTRLSAAMDRAFGSGNLVVLHPDDSCFEIVFGGSLAATNVSTRGSNTIVPNGNASEVITVVHGSNNEAFRIYFQTPNGDFVYPTGASISLDFGDFVTPTITWDSDPEVVRFALQSALDQGFGHGNTAVAFSPFLNEFIVRFDGMLSGIGFPNLVNFTFVSTNLIDVTGQRRPLSRIRPPDPYDAYLSALDPRIVFDSHSNRWFASALNRPNRFTTQRTILVAVSRTTDPTAGWDAFMFDPDPRNIYKADFPTLGVDAQGIYVAIDLRDTSNNAALDAVSVISIPISDLVPVLPSRPTSDHATVLTGLKVSDSGNPPIRMHPALDFDPELDNREPLLGIRGYQLNGNQVYELVRSDVELSGQSGPASLAPRLSIGGFVSFDPGPTNVPQLGSTAEIEAGEFVVYSSIMKRNGYVWLTHAIDVGSGKKGFRWLKVDATSNTVVDSGDIGGRPNDLGLNFYYPSIAVNDNEDVVIGFSGSSGSAYPGAYAVVGSKGADGKIKFGDITTLRTGYDSWETADANGRYRWGDYSATVVDPNDSSIFWTFQEFTRGENQWAINVSQIHITDSFSARPIGVDDGIYVTNEDTPLSVSAGSGLLGNDSDPVGRALTARVARRPEHGVLLLDDNGAFTYKPDLNFYGQDYFEYQVIAGDDVNRSMPTRVVIDVVSVNDAPTLDIISDPAEILEDAGQQTISLSGISPGPLNEKTQSLIVTAASSNPELFSGPISVTFSSPYSTGLLSYTPAPNKNGTAVITVTVTDDGGTANGGVNSFSRTFTVVVSPVADPPTIAFGVSSTYNLIEDVNLPVHGTGIVVGDVDAGPNDALNRVLSVLVATSEINRHMTSVSVGTTGVTLLNSFTPNFFFLTGTAAKLNAFFQGLQGGTYILNSNGEFPSESNLWFYLEVAHGTYDQYGTLTGLPGGSATGTIHRVPVNDAPTFTKGSDKTVADSAVLQTVDNWATGISAIEGGQALDFLVTVPANEQYLFKVLPTIDAPGKLTFESAPNVTGTATVTVRIHDSGGTENGGQDTSAAQTFTITVTKPNRWYNAEGKDEIGFRHLDIDNDGTIELQDARTVIAFLNTDSFKQVGPTDPIGADFQGRSPLFLDVSGDNYVSAIDAVLIINYINNNEIDLISPWHNTTNPLDVNESGSVTTIDAVLIINYLNSPNPAEIPDGEQYGPPFIDVNGDGQVTEADAIVVMNYLNSSPHYWHNSIADMSQDVNADGQINAADYYFLESYLNSFGPGDVPANNGDPVFFFFDVNADDDVDEDDLELLEDLI
jgi:hypothetical protein